MSLNYLHAAEADVRPLIIDLLSAWQGQLCEELMIHCIYGNTD